MVTARVICLEVLSPPPVNSDGHVPGNNIDGVEALLLFPDPRRSRGSSLHYENAAGTSDEIARVVARGMMSMPGKHHVDANLLHSVEREVLPSDRPLDFAAYFQREQRMMGDEDAKRVARGARERLANEYDLFLVDAPVLECQRARRVSMR